MKDFGRQDHAVDEWGNGVAVRHASDFGRFLGILIKDANNSGLPDGSRYEVRQAAESPDYVVKLAWYRCAAMDAAPEWGHEIPGPRPEVGYVLIGQYVTRAPKGKKYQGGSSNPPGVMPAPCIDIPDAGSGP